VRKEELELGESEALIPVAHFQKVAVRARVHEPRGVHSFTPFFFSALSFFASASLSSSSLFHPSLPTSSLPTSNLLPPSFALYPDPFPHQPPTAGPTSSPLLPFSNISGGS